MAQAKQFFIRSAPGAGNAVMALPWVASKGTKRGLWDFWSEALLVSCLALSLLADDLVSFTLDRCCCCHCRRLSCPGAELAELDHSA